MQAESGKVNPEEHRQNGVRGPGRSQRRSCQDLHLSRGASVFRDHDQDLYSQVLRHHTQTPGESAPGQMDSGDLPFKDSKLILIPTRPPRY